MEHMEKHTNASENGPVPPFLPPYFYGFMLVLGIVLDFLLPFPIFSVRWAGAVLGLALVLSGIFIVRLAIKEFEANKVSHRFKAVGKLLTKGPYAYSRNPMYVSYTLIYSGAAFAINSNWPLILLILVLLVIDLGIVRDEEEHLEKKFGEDYSFYKKKVRRWI